MFKVYLDNFLVDEPIGLTELQERLYYNDELAMYLLKLDGDVSFINEGYEYLRGTFNDGLCSKVEVRIVDEEARDEYGGIIFVNDIEWNLSRRLAECNIVSDKYIELIDNNKGIKVQLGVDLDKNQESYAVTPVTTINVPNTTDTTSETRIAFRIFDVFTSLINFMSNGELEFVSDYFDPSGTGESRYDVISYGEELRLDAGELTPLIAFEDFYQDMNRLHNLAGHISGNQFRIEPKSYFRTNQTSINIDNVNEVKQELNRDMFYSSVRFGSSKVSSDFDYLFRFSFNGFQKEQFFLQGQCNTYNELDLATRTLITDTNVIQDMLPVSLNGQDNDQYDEDIILLHCDDTDTVVLTDSPFLSTYYFNQYYTNAEVANRWAGSYPFSIIQLLESVEPLVFATNTTEQDFTTNPRAPYFSPDDDSTPPYYDNNGDWQIGSIPITPFLTENVGYFEAPDDMVVGVEVDFRLTGSYADSVITVVDASGNVTGGGGGMFDLNPNIGFNQTFAYVNDYRVYGSLTVYMPSGSRMYVQSRIGSDGYFHEGGIIRIDQLGVFGGVYRIVNENTTFVSRTDFTKNIPSEEWKTVKNNPFKFVECSYVDGRFKGYPIDITRSIMTGESDIELYQRKIDVDG